jgi:hypothetical protein
MRFYGLFLGLAVSLAATAAHAATATWSEEMTAAPGAAGWTIASGGGVFSNGSTWMLNGASSLLYNSANPASNLETYTYDFRVKLLDQVVTGSNPGRSWPVGVYMSDAANSMGRSQAWYGIEDGEPAYVLDKPYAKFPVTVNNGKAGLQLPIGQWSLLRVVQNQATNTTILYLNGTPIGASAAGGLNGPDDPLTIGGIEAPSTIRVEWDYLRVFAGALNGTEALNAVPEPTAGLLALVSGALAMVRRRR